MPELPEMQALGERIEAVFGGSKLLRFDLLQFSALKTYSPAPAELHGKELVGVSRRAKYLILDLREADVILHLSQGGRVDFEAPAKNSRAKMAVARLTFDNSKALLIKEFGTERKAALWTVEHGALGPIEGLGPEPFSDAYAELMLKGDDKRRVHTMLRDQRTVAGIGRGFSDEILHEARLSPYDSLAKLDPAQRQALVEATRTILTKALAKERQRTGGLPAKIEGRFAIHGHSGDPCPRCNATLHRVSYESHEVVYCPQCQTQGKVLADRRMSRLLR